MTTRPNPATALRASDPGEISRERGPAAGPPSTVAPGERAAPARLASQDRPSGNERLALLAAACLYLLGGGSFVDPDIFHCLSLARESLAAGAILQEDVYAYTPTVSPVVHHEWLHGMVLHAILGLGGAELFLGWKHLLLVAIGACAFLVARRRGAGLVSFAFLAPAATLLVWTGTTTIRAQVYTLLFTAVLLYLLELDRAGRKLWVLPWLLLHVLWLNVHGGFVVGCALVVLHGIEQALRKRPVAHVALGLLAAGALILANPYGTAYYGYLREAIFLDRSSIPEWGPLWRAFPPVFLAWFLSVAIVAYGVWRKGLRGSPGILLLAAGAWAALRHERHASIHAVIWISLAPSLIEGTALGDALRRFAPGRPARALCAVLLVCVVTFSAVAGNPWRLSVPAHPGENERILYPSAALSYLEDTGFRGNALVPFTLGAYVSWKLYPDVRVSIDGRYEAAYHPSLLEEHRTFHNAEPGWKDILGRYPSDIALIPRSRKVAPLMRTESGWSLVYEDDAFEIYARPGLELPRASRKGERLVGTFP